MIQHFKNNNLRNRLKSIVFAGAIVVTCVLPHAALAAAVDLPCTPSQAPAKVAGQDTSAPNNDLYNCINRLYKYALVICSIAGVFMIMLGGYMYIFSGGSDKKVSTAKSFITTSLLGITVLLTGFLLLKQINPSLTTIKSITPQQIDYQEWYVMRAEDGIAQVNTGLPNSGAAVASQCPGGQLVDIPQGEFTQYDKNKTCPIVLEALRKLKAAATAAGISFKVNDSFGSGHSSSCHTQSGTCVDIGLAGSTWDQLCTVVNSTGLFRILNETGGNTPNCGTYVSTSKATGPHLHLNLFK